MTVSLIKHFSSREKRLLNYKFCNHNLDPHSRLKDWYARNYSPKWMKLVLQANLDLEALQNYAVDIFGKIPQKEFEQPEMREKNFDSPVANVNLCKILRILPPTGGNLLALPIFLPPMKNQKRCNPIDFLKFVLSGARNSYTDNILTVLRYQLNYLHGRIDSVTLTPGRGE